MSAQKRWLLGAVALVTASLFVASCGAAIAGVYIAIWGDNAFGGRLIATALFTAFLAACFGVLALKAAEKAAA